MTAFSDTAPTSTKRTFFSKTAKEYLKLFYVFFAGFVLWNAFLPEGLTEKGWHLFLIFIGTIGAIILKPLPMGAIGIISIGVLCGTKTLPLKSVLEGFAYDQIWLIVFACFLARGFIKTGLGRRIAYGFISLFGGTPYGMSYGLTFSSFCMAPLIPSSTARTGGVILPVLESIIQVLSGKKEKSHIDAHKAHQVSSFLTMVVFHASVITSAMFLTANAGNPIAVKFAQNVGIDISWMSWAKASIVPGIVSLILLPVFLRKFFTCEVEDAEQIRLHAKSELHSMGKMTLSEKILIGVFVMLLVLWSCGNVINVHATEAALFGVGILLIAKVLTWNDLLKEDMAWDTFIWMAVLVMMASELQSQGVITWFTDYIVKIVPAIDWPFQVLLLGLIYYYSHYFFASITAHVSSMYGPFLVVCLVSGAPALWTALFLAFLSSLFGGLTHYSSGPAPILYSQGHVDVKTWWKIGIISSVFYLVIWIVIGGAWWKLIGLV